MLRNRWFILGVLFVARFSLGFQFQSAGSVAPFVVEDLGIDYTRVGTLVGLFMIPGLFLAVPSGFIGKRFGDKRIVLIGLALMAAGGALAGAADSYGMIVLGRLVSGAGGAFLFVLMTKMLFDWFAGRELSIGMSIFIIGWPVGIAAGQAVQGTIAEASSWNFVFYLTALGCMIGFATMAALYRSPEDAEARDTGSFSKLSGRELWLIVLAGFIWMFGNGAYVVFLSFGPTLLLERGATIAGSAVTVSLMSWMFLFALPLGGYVATRYNAPNIVMVAGLGASVVLGAMIPYVGMSTVMFILFGITSAFAVPVIAALPAEVLRPENRAPGLGIYFVWYFVGSALIPVLGGWAKDLTGTAVYSLLMGTAMYAACIVLLGLLRLEQRRLPILVSDD
jgi:predicted MFS family arabinose efflux permease